MYITFCDFDGTIITPDNPQYEEARLVWNRGIQRYPLSIAYCKTIDDVKEAVLWARCHHLPIRIRNGGHHYEGYSIADAAVVIDISRMRSIKLDIQRGTVSILGGVQNSELYNTVSKEGYPFPGGTCPTVGVSGYCLGGGWGYSSRYLGLGCDSMIELQLVDYNGCLLTANAHTNVDLFWACKGGGGGNFGVVVSMTFKLPPKVAKVTGFSFYIPNPSTQTSIDFLDKWQVFIQEVSPKLNLTASIYKTLKEGTYIYGRGICYDTPENTLKYLEPFKNLPDINISTTYATFLTIINAYASTYPPYEYFKSSGRFVQQYYSRDTFAALLSLLDGPLPKGSILTSINLYGLGGQITQVAPSDTAFFYRNAYYILQLQTVWEDNSHKASNLRWFNERFPFIYAQTVGSYIGFPNSNLPCFPIDYYGYNSCRLEKVKQDYDPFNVFCFEQSIPV